MAQYIHNDWQDGDILYAADINGIKNIIGDTEISGNTITAAIKVLQDSFNQIDVNTIAQNLSNQVSNNIMPTINAQVQAAQTAAQQARQAVTEEIESLITDIYGSTTIDNGESNSLKSWITLQINNLNIPALSTSINTLSTSISTLSTNVSTILGTDYYNNGWVTVDSNNPSVSARLDTLESQVVDFTDIEKTLGVRINTTLEAPLTTQNASLYAMIDELRSLLGVSSGSSSGTSLITRIERAMGISLNSADSPLITINDKTKSLYTLISEVRGTLGMTDGTAGGGTSSLIDDVDILLNLLYGYSITTVDNEVEITRATAPTLADYTIVNNYPTLYNDVYNASVTYSEPVLDNQGQVVIVNGQPQYTVRTDVGSLRTLINSLYNRLGSISSGNEYLINKLVNYDDIEAKAENSYEAAETATYNDTTYLVLKRDRTATIAESLDDLDDGEYNNSTYIELPKGGGGGGIGYEYQSRFINVQYPTNTTISIGDAVPITFTWSVTDDQDSAISLLGNLTIKVNNISVYNAIVESGTPISYNLGQYITTSGRNTIAISVTNDIVMTRTLYVTVMSYNAVLTSSFNENTVQTGSSIEYQYTASIGSNVITKTLHIEIDGVEVLLNNNETTTESQNSVIFTTPSAGSHLMKVYFTARVSDTNTITSNALYYGILCGVSTNTRITTNFVNGIEVERYSTLTVHYMVYTPGLETTRTEFYINDADAPIAVLNPGPTYQNWNYVVTNAAGPLTITIRANGVETVLTATVVDTNNYDLSMVTSGLKLYLTADQRSNSESNPNYWANSYSGDNVPEVEATLENFLYYRTVDGWQQDNDKAYFLRLRNQNKVTIPFSIFNNTGINRNNLAETGMTLEIDFRTQDVADYNTNIIECFEGESLATSTKNIVLTPQNAVFNNNGSLITQYKEEEKITIAFVINPTTPAPGSIRPAQNSDNLLYIYINGILSAATPYNTVNPLEFTNPNNAKIVLGSTECTLDIYSIRFYESALTYKEIIKNWIYNTTSFDEKIKRYTRNNYNTLSISAFAENSPNTPYMVITGAGPLDGDDAYMPQIKGSEYKKQVDVYYIDPVHPELSFSSNSSSLENFTGVANAQVQGTSSQNYYRKNYKIKLDSFTQDGIFHIKTPADEHYKTTTDPLTGETVITNQLLDNVSKEGYKLRSNSYPEFTFCIKADVASSEGVNNTGLTRIYDEAIRNFVTTPPQHDDPRIRQGVEGYPMVTWYRNSLNGEETLLGRYNFNHDKGTEKVYGLKTALNLNVAPEEREFDIPNGIYDESWEVKNNIDNSLVMFEVPGEPNSIERENAWYATTTDNNGKVTMAWQDFFESRFPDQDDEKIALITDKNSIYLQKRLSGLREVVEWVNDTVEWVDVSKTAVTPESIAKFKTNFEKYFNLNSMLFFYLFTELFLMVDSRAKNLFWTRYQVINGQRPTTAGYDAAIAQNLAPDGHDYFGWFSLPYDFDTAIGINNQGKNVYDYHWESLDVTGPDGSAIFGGQYSKLWVAFRQAYETEFSAFYQQMSNYINYDIVENLFKSNQSIWSEAIVNEDMIVKYINWKTNTGYDMLLGLKDMQRKWWLYNRFKYFDSKFAIKRGIDNINIRIHVNNANIPIQVYADSYVSINVGANSTPTTVRIRRGETGYISVGSDNAGETDSSGIETYISPASALKSVQNLSTFKISSIDASKAIRLQSLQIGTPNVAQANTRLRSVSVTPAEGYTSLLREIDLRNCVACGLLTNDEGEVTTTSPTLDVSGCLFLNKLYLAGTPLHTVSLPNGGVLNTIQYPTTIKAIRIENQPYLTNLIIGNYLPQNEITDINYEVAFNGSNDYSNITSVILDNINEAINVPDIINGSNIIETCSLSNLIFRMSGSDFKVFFNKLDAINATVSNCTLYLTNNLPEGFTVNNITERFDIKVFDKDGNEYYNVRFYNFSRELIATRSVASGGSIFGPDSYFTDEYLNNYNGLTQANMSSHETRVGFGGWDTNLTNITTDLDVYPTEITQYRMDYHYLSEQQERVIYYKYFSVGEEITRIEIPTFIKDYYVYTIKYWTADSNEPSTYPSIDNRTAVANIVYKTASTEHWYAVYKHDEAALYTIHVYNTDIYGNKVGEPLETEPIYKSIIGSNNKIYLSDVSQYLPAKDGIAISNTEVPLALADREYLFLDWQPHISSNGLQVIGDMDLLITYYKKDDDFTNYFINKLTHCNLGNVTNSLPVGAFFHNSNLVKLETSATSVGSYCFANYTAASNPTRYFIFNGDNIDFGSYCFYGIQNCIIIFNGTGQITLGGFNFYQTHNCKIIIPYSNLPIITAPGATQNFYQFLNDTNNYLYVTPTAKTAYTDTTNLLLPSYLVNEAYERIIAMTDNIKTTVTNALIEEANNA